MYLHRDHTKGADRRVEDVCSHLLFRMGTICYSVMVSLGEMIAYLPIPGGHIKLAERFVNRSFSFTMGWNYWYNW